MSTDEMAGVPVLQSPHQIDFLNKVDNLSKSHEWTFFWSYTFLLMMF